MFLAGLFVDFPDDQEMKMVKSEKEMTALTSEEKEVWRSKSPDLIVVVWGVRVMYVGYQVLPCVAYSALLVLR